jgi:hypothetical protein
VTPSNSFLELNYKPDFKDQNPFPLSNYMNFFKSTSNYCLIKTYELVSPVDLKPLFFKNIQMNKDFSLKVDES